MHSSPLYSWISKLSQTAWYLPLSSKYIPTPTTHRKSSNRRYHCLLRYQSTIKLILQVLLPRSSSPNHVFRSFNYSGLCNVDSKLRCCIRGRIRCWDSAERAERRLLWTGMYARVEIGERLRTEWKACRLVRELHVQGPIRYVWQLTEDMTDIWTGTDQRAGEIELNWPHELLWLRYHASDDHRLSRVGSSIMLRIVGNSQLVSSLQWDLEPKLCYLVCKNCLKALGFQNSE